jgi:membrane protease YdiL (CAAX protease family)
MGERAQSGQPYRLQGTESMSAMVRTQWKPAAAAALPIVLGLAAVFAGMRALGTLGPTSLRFVLPLGFVLMAIAPWVLLTGEGRRAIGLKRPASTRMYAHAVVLGAMAALVCFALGLALFGGSDDNWFVSIARSFAQTINPGLTVWQMYLMFTVTSMVFSPIGEEIFFRGVLQRALEDRFPERTSTWLECLAFGLVHLCHHGVVLGAAGWALRPRSAPIWCALMVLTAYLFAWLRKRGDSLYPAMVAHAAYSFTMGTCIFGALWPV